MESTFDDTVARIEGTHSALLSAGGMIVRERESLNLEMPFGSLDEFITHGKGIGILLAKTAARNLEHL